MRTPKSGRGAEGEADSQLCREPATATTMGPDRRTLRSWPEPKQRLNQLSYPDTFTFTKLLKIIKWMSIMPSLIIFFFFCTLHFKVKMTFLTRSDKITTFRKKLIFFLYWWYGEYIWICFHRHNVVINNKIYQILLWVELCSSKQYWHPNLLTSNWTWSHLKII